MIFAVIGFSDYLDGIAARVTGQYSRMGTLLDPLVDRLLVISGVIVCWHFDLLPHWALAVLVAREVFMMCFVRWGMKRRLNVKVNWLGRAGVWPVMSGAVLRDGGRRVARAGLPVRRPRARARGHRAVSARGGQIEPSGTLDLSLNR